MKVLRNGQQVEFSLIEGSLVQETVFRSQASMEMPVKNFLLPLGENDKITVVASTLGLARQMVRMHVAEQEAAAATAKRAEEDAIWEAEGRRAAQRIVAEQVAAMEDHILDAFRNGLHRERGELVNLDVGADRKVKIAEVDMFLGVIEEEQSKRAGLAPSEDILAAVSGPGFETVQDSAHLAYLLDVDEDEMPPSENLSLSVYEAAALQQPDHRDYVVGQRILMINLPYIGATVRSLDESGVGIDYDTDSDEERGTYEALYAHIRPMPFH